MICQLNQPCVDLVVECQLLIRKRAKLRKVFEAASIFDIYLDFAQDSHSQIAGYCVHANSWLADSGSPLLDRTGDC